MRSIINEHINQNMNYQTAILDSITEPVSFIDINYIYRYVNKAFIHFHNIEMNEIINKSVSEVFGKENFIEKIKPNLDKSLKGNHVQWQYDINTHSGKIKVMEINSNPHYNDSNEIDGIVCTTKEIHDPKKLHPKEREILLNETGKLAKVGGWSLDLETNIFVWTKEVYQIAEVPEDFVPTLEKSIKFLDTESKTIFKKANDEAINEGKSYDKELNLTTAKNNKKNVRVLGRVKTDKNSKPIKIYGAIQDITETKKAKQELKESEEKFKMLVQHQGEGIGITDENEVFKFANPAAEKIFGVKESGLVNKSLKNFLSPETYEFIKKQTAKRKKKQKGGYEFDIIQPTGKIVTILVTVNPQLDENGEFLGSFGVFRDITERKKAEKALRENEKKLQELNATKDKLFSIIGHDLRSPMTSILGFSEMIEKKSEQYSREKIREANKVIYDSSQKIMSLLSNLLTWSHSQREKIELFPDHIPIHTIVNRSMDLLKQTAEQKDIHLVNNLPSSFTAYADEEMLTTVIRNLISNAIKFTNKGGTVSAIANYTSETVTIGIRDTGMGIPKEKLQKIFHPDDNYTNKGTEGEEGTGLGLIICKEFIEKNNGEIWVESEEGQGSTFYFTLPLDMPSEK